MIPGIPKNPRPSQTKGKTDGSTVIRFLLSYEDYWRLMVMLLMLGLLAGTVAYVYARPTYMSTASVRIHKYLDTTAVAANVKSEAYLNNRDLGDMLTSPYILLEAGKRIGLATEETTYARFQEESVPKVRVDFLGGRLDDDHGHGVQSEGCQGVQRSIDRQLRCGSGQAASRVQGKSGAALRR